MIPYIFILFSLIILRLCKDDKIYCFLSSLLLILFAGCRGWHVGVDTSQYAYIFNALQGTDWKSIMLIRDSEEQASEIGYTFLCWLFGKFGDYNSFKLLSAGFTLAPAGFLIYKYSKNKCLSFVVFYLLPICCQMSMTMMRQGYAFGFWLLACHYMIQKKWKPYLAFIAIGILFHSSLIVVSPLYLLNWLSYKRKYNILILILLVVIYTFKSILFLFLASYSRMQYEAGDAGGWFTLLYLILLFLSTYFVKETYLKSYINKLLIYFLITTIALWFIGMNLAAVFRLAAYTEFFICLFVPNIYGSICNKNFSRCVIFACLVVGYLMFNSIIFRKHDIDSFVPYYFYWDKNEIV